MSSSAAASPEAPRLRRSLTLWDLILYGIIVIQPVAPMSIFGVLTQRGHGHAATMILVAMIAMLFTAISYGRMARAYPSAGSAFTYVGQEINPTLGYVTGWSMVMDYMLNPIICTIWCSEQAHVFAPGIPYGLWAIFFVLLFTGLNIQGVKTSARINSGLAVGMGVVIAIFFVVAARYIFGHPHDGTGFFTRPFYDPNLWNTKAALGGTSIAVLTYIAVSYTHLDVYKRQDGNAASVTTTLNDAFGSHVTLPGFGFLLNDEMDDFSAKPGAPNMFGLLQGPANAIVPGKRPLSTMTPTMVLKAGKLALVLGSPGGPTIITTVANLLMNVVDYGMDIQTAVNSARFHHQWLPDEIQVEGWQLTPDTLKLLQQEGNKLKNLRSIGDGECIGIDLKTGERLGASDGRNNGVAVGLD